MNINPWAAAAGAAVGIGAGAYVGTKIDSVVDENEREAAAAAVEVERMSGGVSPSDVSGWGWGGGTSYGSWGTFVPLERHEVNEFDQHMMAWEVATEDQEISSTHRAMAYSGAVLVATIGASITIVHGHQMKAWAALPGAVALGAGVAALGAVAATHLLD